MGIWNDANDIGTELKYKRDLEKKASESSGQQDPAAEQKRHEENKEQGMI
jgi:hypothetical protein